MITAIISRLVRGVIFKKQNNHQYTTISIKKVFETCIEFAESFLIIEAQYPLIDEFILKELMNEHLKNSNDLTYISFNWNNLEVIPNIFIINSKSTYIFINDHQQHNIKRQTLNLSIIICLSISKFGIFKDNNILCS